MVSVGLAADGTVAVCCTARAEVDAVVCPDLAHLIHDVLPPARWWERHTLTFARHAGGGEWVLQSLVVVVFTVTSEIDRVALAGTADRAAVAARGLGYPAATCIYTPTEVVVGETFQGEVCLEGCAFACDLGGLVRRLCRAPHTRWFLSGAHALHHPATCLLPFGGLISSVFSAARAYAGTIARPMEIITRAGAVHCCSYILQGRSLGARDNVSRLTGDLNRLFSGQGGRVSVSRMSAVLGVLPASCVSVSASRLSLPFPVG
jgi:hypothetical protein